jgi:hypothetical protein
VPRVSPIDRVEFLRCFGTSVSQSDGQPQGTILAPLNPVEWQGESLNDVPSGGARTRLYERRVQLVAAPEQAQVEAKAETPEPPPVKPGLIRPEEEPKLSGKLRPKSPILNLQPKHNKSPKPGGPGMKAGGGDKPVFKKNGEKVASKPQLPRPGIKAKRLNQSWWLRPSMTIYPQW